MKSSITKKQFYTIYHKLDKVSPIDGDCGLLCGASCCKCTDEDMGIYLLPGEEKLFSRNEEWLHWGWLSAEEYEFPDSWHGKVFFLECRANGNCPREKRPLQCRTFPLTPHIDEYGDLYLIYQKGHLPYSCPLISERIPLNRDFIETTYEAWQTLMQEPLIYDLIMLDSEIRIEDNEDIDIVYPL